jgi:drug/metabolite transporter (DMT)-like permease
LRRVAAAPLGLLALIWGSSYLFIEIALRGFDPGMVAFGRQLIGAACLAPFAISRGLLRVPRAQIPWIALIALVMVGAPTLLVAVGQQTVPSSLAGILVASTPILTAVLALRLDADERPDRRQLLGIVLGLIGVVLLFGLDLGDSVSAILGGGALVLASLGYALGGFIVKHKAADVPPLGLVVFGSAISAALLTPVAGLSLPTDTSFSAIAAVVELGVIGTAAGWGLYYLLIRDVGLQRASIVQYLSPAVAVVLGVVILGEDLTLASVAGLALVVTGSWLAGRRSPTAALSPQP